MNVKKPVLPAIKSLPDISKLVVARRKTIDDFNRLWYSEYPQTWRNMTWYGVPIQKNPCDLWIYQEILYKNRPDTIIETGTSNGGSALYLACMLDVFDGGHIYSIDTRYIATRPVHPRIQYVTGDSSTPDLLKPFLPNDLGKVMIILDSCHTKVHVLRELALYAPMVTIGQYLIVEDTNIHGHPVTPGWGGPAGGPFEAVQEFMQGNTEFVVDKSKEKFMLTFNPGGYLKRIK